ncbi:YdbH domain-containing protein [Moritella sp. 24]|uniref:intermembrane phospholipid transport protein YdbH family protein n=1 Tax=Moritella sp. 24 TaxID=2746230 RepID=UPI001BA6EAC2|nr:YdbH domain-containing protein [Moritella sp. 24]QUM76314.1 YdbH domain-containing protein [Moritella sp. 24]
MSTPKQTTKSSNKVIFWILGLSILVMLSVVTTFMNRERILTHATNHFSTNYGVKVEELAGFTIQFDFNQPFFVDSISLEQLKVDVDYLQLEQATQEQGNKKKATPVNLVIPELPYWIPDLHITNITIQGDNLPDFAFEKEQLLSQLEFGKVESKKLKLNTLDFKNIDFRYTDSYSEFLFSVWLQDQQLLTTQLSYGLKTSGSTGSSKASDSQTSDSKILKARLATDLAKTNALITRVLPDIDMSLSGDVQLELVLDPQKTDRIALQVLLTDGGLTYAQIPAIMNAELSLNTTLVEDNKGWLPEKIDVNLVNISPMTLSVDNCSQLSALFKIASSVCQSFQQGVSPVLDPIVITPQVPLSLQVRLQDRDVENWLVKSKSLALTALMSDSKLVTQADELKLTPQSWQAHWAFSAETNSRYFSDVLQPTPVQMAAKGHVSINPTVSSANIELAIKTGSITAQKFKYTDISSDDIRIHLLEPTTIQIENNKIQPFDSAFSTTLFNNRYQKNDKINRLTAQHQMQFSEHRVALNSDWQLDDAILTSNNTVSLSNRLPTKVTGYWQVPKQTIPSFIINKYPLPTGLYLPASVTNRVDYTLNLDEGSPYLSANIVGEMTADSSDFNDFSATDINNQWRCKVSAADPDIAASLNASCQVNSAVSSVNVGPIVHNVNVSGLVLFANEQLQVAVDNASAEIFSGTVSVAPLLITDFDHIVGQLYIRNLSLPEALELYQVPGVNVTGLLKADLPFIVQGKDLSITDGTIEQQGDGGVIQIKDNVTIDQLKLTQPQLRYALELLENLHYDRLHSDVNFKPSGETKLTINIKGRNPSVERPIEFNYSHEENILQLFRSLRINDSMYDALDKMNNP